MLRERNSIGSVIYNWFIMLTVIIPTMIAAMLAYVYGTLWLLGAI